MNTTLHREQLIQQLHWRYATKQFDSQRRISPEDWAARQAYVALGNFLNSAAMLGIDAGPMEGFRPDQYDQLLGLDQQGLSAVVIAAAGYRAATDKYAALPKVRFPREQVIEHI